MGKLNEIQKQTTQSYGDNSFTTTIKENTVEFDSLKDSFTFNDEVNVPSIKINGTEIATFDAEDKAKLDSLTSTMQVKGRVDGISDLPDDASVGDTYLVGLSGDGNFEEYVCTEIIDSPVTPVWENLGHVKVQSDWNQSNNSSDNYIKNKPAIKAGQGSNSIIEGDIDTNVAGVFSHAEGYRTEASGNYGSHAEGNETTASGTSSHAEGTIVTASGTSSHAEGFNTTASGSYSHTEGHKTTAKNRSQHAFGEYNELDPSAALSWDRGTYIEIVGNGTDENVRSNARTLDWDGNEVLAGKITANGVNLNDELNLKQNALGFTPENVANKKTTLDDNSDAYYPTQKAVKTAVDAKADDTKVAAIQGLIPTLASPTNQLADKDFVNSSIGTSTAIFRGTFTSVDDLPTTGVDNNDYTFVKIFDSIQTDEVLRYDRYKWSDGWSFEYSLNNSSFTAAQWDAINSNATASIISDLLSHASNISNPHAVTKSQVGLGDVDNTSDLNKPLSTAAVAEFATKQDTLIAGNNITIVGNTISSTGGGPTTVYKSITIENPTASENMCIFYAPVAMTITEIRGVITGATSVSFKVVSGTSRNAVTTEHNSSAVVCSSVTTGDVATITTAAVAAGSWVAVKTSAIAGAPSELVITLSLNY